MVLRGRKTFDSLAPMDGLDMAQKAMRLGEAHGWAMNCTPEKVWTSLVMTRGMERLELNWKMRTSRTGWRLADTRSYTNASTGVRRSKFSYASALRLITSLEG